MLRIACLLSIVSFSVSATQITPVSVDASSSFRTYQPQSLIDGSGLSGGLHDANFQNMWLSDNAFLGVDPYFGVLTFDFGNTITLTSLRLWNYNYPGDSGDAIQRGVQTFEVLYLSGTDYLSLGSFNLAEGTGNPLPAQDFNLTAPVNTSSLRLNLLTNYGDRDYIGLSEVQFFSNPTSTNAPPTSPGPAVPEPSHALSLAAALALGCLYRRTR